MAPLHSSLASNSTQSAPACRRRWAHNSPAIPPPTMRTSVFRSPSNGGNFGRFAVCVHIELMLTTSFATVFADRGKINQQDKEKEKRFNRQINFYYMRHMWQLVCGRSNKHDEEYGIEEDEVKKLKDEYESVAKDTQWEKVIHGLLEKVENAKKVNDDFRRLQHFMKKREPAPEIPLEREIARFKKVVKAFGFDRLDECPIAELESIQTLLTEKLDLVSNTLETNEQRPGKRKNKNFFAKFIIKGLKAFNDEIFLVLNITERAIKLNLEIF